MTPTHQGSFKLFRFAGIDVFLHWSWFLVAAYQISVRDTVYGSYFWNIFEYLSLFGIVLFHEFGHALACRQVGGQANQIVLWPLGGVAYVAPPPRPGATLWAIAAGPLVNVLLAPVFAAAWFGAGYLGWAQTMPNLYVLIQTVCIINIALLVFNLLPVFPLDGGQILRSLLWFTFGRGRSLLIASIIGFLGVAGLIALSFWMRSVWMGILSLFILMNCWRGFQQAHALMQMDRLPRHLNFACPGCRMSPLLGEYWLCGYCRQPFDTFATQSFCPRCAAQFALTQCLECGKSNPISQWILNAEFSPLHRVPPIPPQVKL